MTSRSRLVLPLLVLFFAACASRPVDPSSPSNACGEEMVEDRAEMGTVTHAIVDKARPKIFSAIVGAVQPGRTYAIVDQGGYVGTIIASQKSRMCDVLAMVGCVDDTWFGSWIHGPTHGAKGDAVAFGPVNGRFVSAKVKELHCFRPDPGAPCAGPGSVTDDGAWTASMALDFASEPRSLEVRRRRCELHSVVSESRVVEAGKARVIRRTVTDTRVSVSAKRALLD